MYPNSSDTQRYFIMCCRADFPVFRALFTELFLRGPVIYLWSFRFCFSLCVSTACSQRPLHILYHRLCSGVGRLQCCAPTSPQSVTAKNTNWPTPTMYPIPFEAFKTGNGRCSFSQGTLYLSRCANPLAGFVKQSELGEGSRRLKVAYCLFVWRWCEVKVWRW